MGARAVSQARLRWLVAALALPVLHAACPGQHTWTANGIIEGTFEGARMSTRRVRQVRPCAARMDGAHACVSRRMNRQPAPRARYKSQPSTQTLRRQNPNDAVGGACRPHEDQVARAGRVDGRGAQPRHFVR
jgi:hypothetical protein